MIALFYCCVPLLDAKAIRLLLGACETFLGWTRFCVAGAFVVALRVLLTAGFIGR